MIIYGANSMRKALDFCLGASVNCAHPLADGRWIVCNGCREHGGGVAVETCTSEPIALGAFRYSVTEGRLWDEQDTEVFLRPQSAMVLNVLARNLGQVVSKNDLISEVWQHISVTDDSLTQCIADIRRAIQDKDRAIVKTLPKRGYMVVSEAEIDVPVPVDVDVDVIATSVGAKRVPIVLIEALDTVSGPVALLNLVSTVFGRFNARLRTSRERTVLVETDDTSLAIRLALEVMKSNETAGMFRAAIDLCDIRTIRDEIDGPRVFRLISAAGPKEILATQDIQSLALDELDCKFEDLGERNLTSGAIRLFRVLVQGRDGHLKLHADASSLLPTVAVIPFQPRVPGERALLGEVIAEDVISALSRSTEVNVTSRLSTRAFSTRGATLAEVGYALQADYVLSGSFIEHSDKVTLNVELSEVQSKRVLWTDRIEGNVATVLQDLELVHQIVSNIRRMVFMSEIRNVKAHPLLELSNHNLLLGAVGLMHRMSRNDFETARTLLDALSERVATQPAPWAWSARWHVLRVQQGWASDPEQEAQAALDSARRALDIDPENSLALASEGMVLTNLSHRLDEAEDRYNTALEFNPNDAYGALLRGALYGFQGKGDEAKKDTDHALHLAPLDPHRFFFLALAAGANLAAEDFERAQSLAETSLRMNRSHTSTLRIKIVAQMRLGQGDAARETAKTLLKLQPGLKVGEWLKNSPTREFKFGEGIASDLRDAGIPE